MRHTARSFALAVLATVLPLASARAQRPTPDQARQLIQSRPDLVRQLRDRILRSGLTPAQVRARLRAEGYPENMLDAYLPGSTSMPADSIPGPGVFGAVRALGISDSTAFLESDSLQRIRRRLLQGDSLRTVRRGFLRDSLGNRLPGDSTVPFDSLAPFDFDTAKSRQPQIFGLALFRSATSQFDANLAGPVDANYRLGPGDQLVLILTGDVQSAETLDVTREGFVVIPQVGQIPVANLSLSELHDILYERLGRVYSGVRRGAGATTRFSISVARLRSNQVFVIGDVQQPGSYRVSSAGTALTALYAAGGPTDNGSLRRVEVRRGGKIVQTLDVYDYLLQGDASRDARLETGDVVFVPVHGRRIEVTGEVTRPAIYELATNETLADAIRMAGGFAPSASLSRIQIERIAPPSSRPNEGRARLIVDVTAPTLASGEPPAFNLEAGDLIRVFKVADRVRGRVSISGNVWQQGAQGFVPGMTLSQAIRRAGGTKSDTYLGQVLISRLRPDSTRMQLRATLADSTGAVVNDIPLVEDDEIRVFSVGEFRPIRYVAVSGAVRAGGRFVYREGMTMRDLVLLAGGLEESALLNEAEVARLPVTRDGGTTAQTIRVALDSSYLFERGADGRYLGPPGLPAPNGVAPEIALKPYDNVLILRQPDFQLQRTVALGGEVRFPGRYSLRTKTDRISDVLARAGGLTPEGYAEGIQFFRDRNNVGRIGINLPRIMRHHEDRDNLILESGDSIYLPRYNPVVDVVGAVNAPVAVAYVPGKDVDYYIRRAGGGTRNSDGRRAYVTQPNGDVESRARRLFFVTSTPVPRAGGVVHVPDRDPNDRKDYTAIAGSIAQVLASLVAIIVIAKR
ncbi:MAG: SLBB domain-containing protein [Gemmatimonadaceae bacterium]